MFHTIVVFVLFTKKYFCTKNLYKNKGTSFLTMLNAVRLRFCSIKVRLRVQRACPDTEAL